MKKFLLIAAVIVLVLFMIDKVILKDKGIVKQLEQAEKFEKIQNPNELPIGLKEGDRSPDFELIDLDGNPIKLSDFKGTPVFLNFWASWCGPCKAEMPHMEKLYAEKKDGDFEILAVNVTTSEKNISHVEKFVADYGLTFPIPLDEKGSVAHQYEIIGYPTSFFIDSDGVIRSKALGPLNEEEMKQRIKRLP
ncbi:TlpA disulfide reductase family protein [Bacillus sp. Bva_UNVM-123]|uniref:TlpA disulfide reductase family protein n=1 Tax=Bacillus sp. Bva_UNVM-123 TaxID=2829798 RepID=UPI00391F2F2D